MVRKDWTKSKRSNHNDDFSNQRITDFLIEKRYKQTEKRWNALGN